MSSKILPNLLLLLLLAPTCFSLTKEWAEVLISEVYIGNNSQEDFIELNSGSGNFSFTNFSLDINSNDSSRSFPLDGQQTNSKGFLVLSAKNNKVLMEHLREVHNVTINITLTHHTLIHHTIILRSFQTNVVICYKEVSPIQLASNLSTEGSVNNCPLSPVHIEQVSFLNDSTLAVILHSNDLPKWKLKSLEVNVTLDGNLAHSTSLDEFTTDDNETYSLSISFDSKQEQTTAVLLYFVSNTSGPIVLDGVAFGNGSKSSINLTKIWTYPYLYPPKEKAMQYIELNSNGNGMVKFFHYDLSFKLFVLVPGNTGPSKNNASTSASSPMSSTIPSSSPSTSLNTTMTTETFLSTNSTNNSSEVTTDVNATTSSNDTISTSVPYTTVTEAFNDTSTQSTENTTASNGSTITYATPTSYNTTVGHTEETTTSNNSSTDSMEMSTSNFTDVTSHDNKSTPSSTTETSDYTTTSSSPPSSQSPTETSGTVQHDVLKINEIKLDGNLPSNNWIELRSKESNSSSKYVLVWSTLDQMSNRSITFNNLITQNQSLMIIDKKKDDYSEFVKQLTIGSGVLKLQHDKSNQLVDCVSYMISDVPVAKERKAIMQNQCSKHPPVLITKREILAGWTINFCEENHFQIAGSSYNTLKNLCPSTRNRPLSMVMLNVKNTKDFKSQLTYEFVRKISEKKGCMISKDFIEVSNVTRSSKDKSQTLVIIILHGYNASHLQTLYKGYESLFTPDSTVFKINNENITVYRKSAFVDTLTKRDTSNATVTVAVLLSLLAVFVFIAVVACLYMKYKRKNLTNLFSKLYFRSDQDDLLVNMEDVNTQESHFNNPYYNQLSV